MRFRSLAVWVSIVGGTSFHSALAQGITADHCLDLAREVARGEAVSFSEEHYRALGYFIQCERSSLANTASAKALIKAFSISGDYSQNHEQAACEEGFQAHGISGSAYNSATLIFDRGLDSVDACNELAANNWLIEVERIHKHAVSFSIAFKGTTPSELRGIDLIPKDEISCYGDETIHELPTKIHATPVTFTCERESYTTSFQNIVVETAPEVTVNLRLAERPFPVHVAAFTASPMQGIERRLGEMNQQITDIHAALRNLRQQTNTRSREVQQIRDNYVKKGENVQIKAPNENQCIRMYGNERAEKSVVRASCPAEVWQILGR